MLAVLLAVHVWFGTYSVLDVGKPGVPQLTTLQARWLHLIHAVPAYAKRWQYMRFVKQPRNKYLSVPPLVVFDAQALDRLSESNVAAYEAWFHVIGEPCSATYVPSRDLYVGQTSAACSSDQLLPSVPGESGVLKP